MNKQRFRCEDIDAWNCRNVAVARYRGMLRCKRHLTRAKTRDLERGYTDKHNMVVELL